MNLAFVVRVNLYRSCPAPVMVPNAVSFDAASWATGIHRTDGTGEEEIARPATTHPQAHARSAEWIESGSPVMWSLMPLLPLLPIDSPKTRTTPTAAEPLRSPFGRSAPVMSHSAATSRPQSARLAPSSAEWNSTTNSNQVRRLRCHRPRIAWARMCSGGRDARGMSRRRRPLAARGEGRLFGLGSSD